jgi:hypothetical protein
VFPNTCLLKVLKDLRAVFGFGLSRTYQFACRIAKRTEACSFKLFLGLDCRNLLAKLLKRTEACSLVLLAIAKD